VALGNDVDGQLGLYVTIDRDVEAVLADLLDGAVGLDLATIDLDAQLLEQRGLDVMRRDGAEQPTLVADLGLDLDGLAIQLVENALSFAEAISLRAP